MRLLGINRTHFKILDSVLKNMDQGEDYLENCLKILEQNCSNRQKVFNKIQNTINKDVEQAIDFMSGIIQIINYDIEAIKILNQVLMKELTCLDSKLVLRKNIGKLKKQKKSQKQGKNEEASVLEATLRATVPDPLLAATELAGVDSTTEETAEQVNEVRLESEEDTTSLETKME